MNYSHDYYYPFYHHFYQQLYSQFLLPGPSFPFNLPTAPTHSQIQIKIEPEQGPTNMEIESQPLPASHQSQLETPAKTTLKKASTKAERDVKKIEGKKSQKVGLKPKKVRTLEQKAGRNSFSNFLRMFFRKLTYKVTYNPHSILRIIHKYNFQITIEEFLSWISVNQVDYKNYVRVSSIRRLFLPQPFIEEHTNVLRIMLKDFIDNELIISSLTSKKTKRGAQSHDFGSFRALIHEIIEN